MVDLHQDCPPAAFQALDHPALPRRTVQVEGTLQGVGDRAGQLGVVARARNRHPAHMMGQVESGTVDPLEALRPQHLCAARYRLNPFRQQLFQQCVIGDATIDDGDRADHQAGVLIGILSSQVRRIQCYRLRHAQSPPLVSRTCTSICAGPPGR